MASMQDHWERMYSLPLARIPWEISEPPLELLDVVSGLDAGGMKALDVACGTGNYSQWLATVGMEVTGIDFSARAIAIAQERNTNSAWSVKFHQGDVTRLRQVIVSTAFDFILDYSLLHHLDDEALQRHAAQFTEFLSKDGLMLVVCYSQDHEKAGATGSSAGEFGNVMRSEAALKSRNTMPSFQFALTSKTLDWGSDVNTQPMLGCSRIDCPTVTENPVIRRDDAEIVYSTSAASLAEWLEPSIVAQSLEMGEYQIWEIDGRRVEIEVTDRKVMLLPGDEQDDEFRKMLAPICGESREALPSFEAIQTRFESLRLPDLAMIDLYTNDKATSPDWHRPWEPKTRWIYRRIVSSSTLAALLTESRFSHQTDLQPEHEHEVTGPRKIHYTIINLL